MFILHVFGANGHRIETNLPNARDHFKGERYILRDHLDLDALQALIADPEVNFWLDLQCPTEEESRALSRGFGFHPLAVEDAIKDYGHPKIDTYEEYVFLIVHGINFDMLDFGRSLEIETVELDIFLGPRYLVTHQGDNAVRSVWELHAEVEKGGHRPWTPVRLLHHVLDKMIDKFLPEMDKLGTIVEKLEDQIVHKPTPELLEQVMEARKSILRIRRIAAHQRLVLESLARGHLELIPRDSLAFYRDVYDHFVRVLDLIDDYREIASAAIEAYRSITAHKTNEIMRVLTAFSTFFLPLTFIAGIYGMNFEVMPELKWGEELGQPYGYVYALGLMALTALGLFLWFRRRGWA